MATNIVSFKGTFFNILSDFQNYFSKNTDFFYCLTLLIILHEKLCGISRGFALEETFDTGLFMFYKHIIYSNHQFLSNYVSFNSISSYNINHNFMKIQL